MVRPRCPKGVCKYWMNTGRCPIGNECSFSHSVVGKQNTLHVEVLSKDGASEEHDSNTLVSRHSRARVFAEWIKATFPEATQVLDVGGGKGEMAFELGLRRGLTCAVVDPRHPRNFEDKKSLPKWQRKILAKNPDFRYTHHQTEFNQEFCQSHWDEISSKLKSGCALVIGMHPDEATEPMVDLCLKFGRSFAVVPCCVFAHQFPHRRLKSGDEPRTYQQFCQYLLEKDPRIETSQLNFKGRNTVLFHRMR